MYKLLTKASFLALFFCWTIGLTHADTKPGDKEKPAPTITEKRIMGWVENVYLTPDHIKLKAKLDTGAKTSSLDARDIEYFEKNGEKWVRFKIIRKGRKAYIDKKGRSHPAKDPVNIQIERPLLRIAKIKRHKRSSVERPVVRLPIIIGGREYEPEFTLTNRRKFIYPVLLGRRFLREVAIVDPSKTFLTTERPSQVKNKQARIPTQKSNK